MNRAALYVPNANRTAPDSAIALAGGSGTTLFVECRDLRKGRCGRTGGPPVRGEVPVSHVVARLGQMGSSESWSPLCKDRLAKTKRPPRVGLVDEFLRNSVAKFRKFLRRREARS